MDKKDVEKLVETHDKQIEAEIKKIEQSEQKIEDEEKQILDSEKRIMRSINKKPFSAFFIEPGTTAKEFGFFRQIWIKRFSRKRRLLFALVVTTAIVLIWRGIWVMVDETPYLSIAVVSLILGIAIIWILQKYTDLN